jgi:CPA1 family monovalent cation:H+ antiporter
MPPWSAITVIGWTGMRGIVSLAAALALPLRDTHGDPLPGRDAITFITFVVIFVTLVGQGLTLIPLLRWLRIPHDADGEEREIAVRVAGLEAGLKKIAELERTHKEPWEREVLQRLRYEYEHRIDHLRHHAAPGGEPETLASQFDHEAQEAVLRAERREIVRLRDRGEIPDEIFRRVEYDIDLAAARLF